MNMILNIQTMNFNYESQIKANHLYLIRLIYLNTFIYLIC